MQRIAFEDVTTLVLSSDVFLCHIYQGYHKHATRVEYFSEHEEIFEIDGNIPFSVFRFDVAHSQIQVAICC